LTLNSDGFSPASTGFLTDTYTYVGWQWRGSDSSAVSNTQGTITSTVSANTTAGFSVVTYSANSSSPATATIGHGLGAVPSMIIVKPRNTIDSWYVYHVSVGNTKFLELNATAAETVYSTMWENTSPTSTVFTTKYLNQGNYNYVAYCFAPVAGYSAFGKYTGNGSDDGPFIYTGFTPKYVLVKRSDSADQWVIKDTARLNYNVNNVRLFAESSNAESTGVGAQIDILSNGFKCRSSNDLGNLNGGTYIYAAFAEVPTKFALGR
jgi:hypothetical protein